MKADGQTSSGNSGAINVRWERDSHGNIRVYVDDGTGWREVPVEVWDASGAVMFRAFLDDESGDMVDVLKPDKEQGR